MTSDSGEHESRSVRPKERVDRLCERFESAWRKGEQPRLEEFVGQAPDLHSELLRQLLLAEWDLRWQAGQSVVVDAYEKRFATDALLVRQTFGEWERQRSEKPTTAVGDLEASTVDPKRSTGDSAADGHPENIGRYRVERLLGEGGFGRVYLAQDTELDRRVAVKVPKLPLLLDPDEIEAYRKEARTVARLDHANIVPVLHSGSTDQFPVFVVTKFIEGTNLANKLKESRLGCEESAGLIATVAEALQYAHVQGLVHRDIKPGNILLDVTGKPFVVDFGLALQEQERGKGSGYAGTPPYMSPEQARGEGHRVDSRSDIFSLSVVLYELLTARRPFGGETDLETLMQITTLEPSPPRRYDPGIPNELERICLKGLAKRAVDRYTTALDLADDLRHFVSNSRGTATEEPSTPLGAASRDTDLIKIIPKGLRSFDEHDADFFLELLPGPRDRDGLPDSIRFWKTRIEETDDEKTFTVGLLYGPSGCGKSSLVKAGLLPRLADHVVPVYVEATPDETESRLLRGLRKHFPTLDENLDLLGVLAALRRGKVLAAAKKVLIVLDQFEQWLHAKKGEENTELVEALRQCDGGRVQCVVMVRDDFWMAATRFMRNLEVRLVEASNSAAVDVFPVRHAEKVLAAFGRSFSVLPENPGDISEEQRDFLQKASAGLAEDNKVICVRLALFAEMMKGRGWTPAVLQDVGGTTGVGVTFLEETFAASTAPPEHRYHQKAARAVLKALLPDSGTDIKGHMRSRKELLDASGYASRSRDFEDLIRILDSEIRLITPTDPEGMDDSAPRVEVGEKYYQLTHDYLVPSLRDWLTRQQKETRQGRAELRLAERAVMWNEKPESRYLPSWREYRSIWWYTTNWTPTQRKMMRTAGRLYGVRFVTGLAVVALLALGGVALQRNFAEGQRRTRVAELINGLLNADANTVAAIANSVAEERDLAEPRLRSVVSSPETAMQKLHALLALVHFDASHVEPLRNSLLQHRDLEYVSVIREVLQPNRSELSEELWQNLHDQSAATQTRFRSALALAGYEPDSGKWTEGGFRFVADQLVTTNPAYQNQLWPLLSDISQELLDPLETVCLDAQRADVDRNSAATAICEFAPRDAQRLARLLTTATSRQYHIFYPVFSEVVDAASLDQLHSLVQQQPEADLLPDDRLSLGKRRAGAAITLLRQGERESIFDVLRVTDDPESLTQFVHRCRARGVTSQQLIECLDRVAGSRQAADREQRKRVDPVQYALLLALGEYRLEELPESERAPLVDRLAESYRNDPSSAVHSATGWLLRRWGCDEQVAAVDHAEDLPYDETGEREWFVMAIELLVEENSGILGRLMPGVFSSAVLETVYFTFVVFPPGEFRMGSPDTEPNRDPKEDLHIVKLTRPIAVSDREVSWGQYTPVAGSWLHDSYERQFSLTLTPGDAVAGLTWFEAVDYCRALTALLLLEQCYDDPESLAKDADGNLKDWPLRLGKSGFRLLTEAEWEFVCRGDTQTAFGFGHDEQLLRHYAWFQDNSEQRSYKPPCKLSCPSSP